MPQGLVYAVHGFLGQASDWNEIRKPIEQKQIMFEAADLFSKESPSISNFESYVEKMAAEIKEIPASKKIFLGYSLGGRLGLHLLQHKPELFDHYVFLSTNPGMAGDQSTERVLRLNSDQQWANRITQDNWEKFNQEWNAQKVFEGSAQEPKRYIKDFDLDKLKAALTTWSLANQKDFSQVIQKHQNKITWVVGEKDTKYLQIAEDLKQKKILLDYKRIFSGHRIWSDQPMAVSKLLSLLIV